MHTNCTLQPTKIEYLSLTAALILRRRKTVARGTFLITHGTIRFLKSSRRLINGKLCWYY